MDTLPAFPLIKFAISICMIAQADSYHPLIKIHISLYDAAITRGWLYNNKAKLMRKSLHGMR